MKFHNLIFIGGFNEILAILVVFLLALLVSYTKEINGILGNVGIDIKSCLGNRFQRLLSDGVTSGTFPVNEWVSYYKQGISVLIQRIHVHFRICKHLLQFAGIRLVDTFEVPFVLVCVIDIPLAHVCKLFLLGIKVNVNYSF